MAKSKVDPDRNLGSGYDLALMVSGLQSVADEYKSFAEEVLLMCAMPETERFVLEDKFDDPTAEEALTALMKLLYKYRRLLAFLIKNHIDAEKVMGDGDNKKS